MSNTQKLTFATLGVALVALIAAAENDPALKKNLETFKVDFDALDKQTESEIKDQLDAQAGVSNTIISELKSQLNEALVIKESKTEALIVTVDKTKYVVNHGSHPYSKEQIAESPEIAKGILKITGQNAISKL